MNAIGLQDLDSFPPSLNREEMMEWFQKRLQRQPEQSDFLKVFNFNVTLD
jgi:hypothetical protein